MWPLWLPSLLKVKSAAFYEEKKAASIKAAAAATKADTSAVDKLLAQYGY
jgi:hypothetical protein